jgi:TolB-like protein/DNA-binding winged helix-turn-helix (wHTH) protein/Flp pilus assembly protein TadD
MPSTVQNLIYFADFVVDQRAGELRKGGVKVRLQEQPFRVLAALLESSGEVVTREELRTRLWPADTFVDFDHRLAAAVNKIRDALGDSAQNARFIETVGRRGYRFLVPVELGEQQVMSNGNGQTQDRVEPPILIPAAHEIYWRRTALVGGALALFLMAGFLTLRRWVRSDAASSTAPRISSIAVLPLENLSNDPEQQYFVEGMTDEITTDLAKLPGIRVISRTSAMQYKNTHKTMPQIAKELNVDAVVEGTVLRVGNRVRIRTQLIYAPADRHVWAQAYERDLKDVLTLQANLAQDIAGEIQLKLTTQQRANLAVAHSVDPEAHEFYLKGRYFWNKRDEASFAKAIDYFQQAIAKDPTYAAAYAGLADSYALLGGFNLVPVEQAMPRARAAAEKALELDSNLAEAHASLGLIAPFNNWNWADAERHYQRAIELNPNYATAHHWYAEGYLMPVGRAEEAIAEMRKAQELDPLSAVIATDLGKELYFVRRYDEALVELHRALELDPNFTSAHNWISDTLVEKQSYNDAIAELEKTKPSREERVYIRQTAYLYARMGRRTEARAALAKALELSKGKQVSSGAVALTYAALDDKDESFRWLEKAYTQRSSFMTSLKYWPVFDQLRGDPRFADLLRRVGLPQ